MSRLTFRALLAGVCGLATTLLAPSAGAQARASRSPASARADSVRIRTDVAYLASDRLEGRLTGTPGNDSAAAYIARRFQSLALRPIVVDAADSARCAANRSAIGAGIVQPARCAGYLQRFTARVAAFAHVGKPFELPTQNVVALIPGRDPALRGQVIVLGAHYDHLGRDTIFAADPRAGAVIHNGADDNASGTAAVMELARLIAARPTRRSVLVVAFSGEEEGVLGSQWFVDHAPVPTDSIVAMLNFDMVGRLTNDRLLVYGVATADELPAIVDSANANGPKLAVKALGDGQGPSDHASFYLKGIPVLHFFTDQHADYHAATDDAEKIDAAGEARVVDLAALITRDLGDRPARLTFKPGPVRVASGGSDAPRPYFGSVPDMAGDGSGGLRLSGVTPGGPADKAGVKAGDVVVEFGGTKVTDLYTYQDALTAHKPGDVVTVVVLRPGANGAPAERVSLTVTLGRRGQ
jgi:hypothetical protein